MKLILFAGISLLISNTISQEHHQPNTPCGKHQELDGHFCICKMDYVRFRGFCVKCPSESIYDKFDKACRCKRGMLYDRDTNTCRPVCEVNEMVTTDGCECRDGYYYIRGKCSKCPDNSWFDQNTQLCFCLKGYADKGGKCIKIDQQNALNENMVQNSARTKTNSNKNKYPQGYLAEDCYQQQDKEQSSSSTDFKCQDSDTKQNQQIAQQPIHQSNQLQKVKETTQQQTNNEQYRKSRLIKEGQQKNQSIQNANTPILNMNSSEKKAQQKEQQSKSEENLNQEKIKCGTHEISIPNGGCQCKEGYHRYDGINCVSCPKRSSWNRYLNRCQCAQGYRIYRNKCIQDACPPNQIFIPGEGCKCEPGYHRINGTNCQSCPTGSTWKNKQCICDDGLTMINNQCHKIENQTSGNSQNQRVQLNKSEGVNNQIKNKNTTQSNIPKIQKLHIHQKIPTNSTLESMKSQSKKQDNSTKSNEEQIKILEQ